MEVRSRLGEADLEGQAVRLLVILAGRAGGVEGLDAQGSLEFRRIVIRCAGIGAAPFGSAHDLIGDGGILASRRRVDVAGDRIFEALGVQQGAIAVLLILAQGEGHCRRCTGTQD